MGKKNFGDLSETATFFFVGLAIYLLYLLLIFSEKSFVDPMTNSRFTVFHVVFSGLRIISSLFYGWTVVWTIVKRKPTFKLYFLILPLFCLTLKIVWNILSPILLRSNL